jgi:acyl-CoA thioester hydrolase
VTRTRIFSKRFAVPAEAIEHSATVGWSMGRYLELGAGWVVRSHFIEYFRPAFADELLSVHTWVPHFDQRSTPRRYLFVRDGDRAVLAEADARPRDVTTILRGPDGLQQ